MIELYLADGPGSEADRSALTHALAVLPTPPPLAWVEKGGRRHLGVHVVTPPSGDFVISVELPDGTSWPDRATRLADPVVRLRWLTTVLARIRESAMERILLVPGPFRDATGLARLTEQGLVGLRGALPDLPTPRWLDASRGAVRMATSLVRDGVLAPGTTIDEILALLVEPLWSPSDRAALERQVWTDLTMLPHEEAARALSDNPSVAASVGAYAAAATGPAPAIRLVSPAWVIPADAAVATFLKGSAAGVFRGAV